MKTTNNQSGLYRIRYRRGSCHHDIYLNVSGGIVTHAPPLLTDWKGKRLVDIVDCLRAKHPKTFRVYKWGEMGEGCDV